MTRTAISTSSLSVTWKNRTWTLWISGSSTSPCDHWAFSTTTATGTFAEVSHLLGDIGSPGKIPGEYGNLWGAGFQPGWVDFDNDGDPDLYVVNDFGRDAQPNVLWRNDGPAADGIWQFEDISRDSRADVAMFGMGLAVGDYDLDGHFDLYVTNIEGQRPAEKQRRRDHFH